MALHEFRSIDWGQLIVGGLVGILGIIVQATNLRIRDQRPYIVVVIMVISVIIIALVLYYTAGFSPIKRIEFLGWSIGLLLNAIYAAFASIYFSVVKKFQAEVLGQVYLNNVPSQGSKVELYRKDSGADILVDSTDRLKLGGSYVFYCWIGDTSFKYQIVATNYSSEGRSDEFELSRGKKKEVPVINLTSSSSAMDTNVPALASAAGGLARN